MKGKRFYVDTLLKETLKKEDKVHLPSDPMFYENMQTNIMAAIQHTEIETQGSDQNIKWSKPWVFLEPGINLEEGSIKLHSNKKSPL